MNTVISFLIKFREENQAPWKGGILPTNKLLDAKPIME
jgi:hypothetical protein